MLVKYLIMTFKTEGGDNATVSVSGIKEDLTAAEIAAAMDVIIKKDAFIAKGGSLKSKAGAQVVSRNVDEFEVMQKSKGLTIENGQLGKLRIENG